MMTVTDYLDAARPYDTAMADAMREACGAARLRDRAPYVIDHDEYARWVTRMHEAYWGSNSTKHLSERDVEMLGDAVQSRGD